MSYIDIGLIVIIGAFGLFGLWFGLVHSLGSLIGTFFGAYLATRFFGPVSALIIRLTGWNLKYTEVIIFILLFFIINRLIGLAFLMIYKVINVIIKLPFVGSINRVLGLVFGLCEGGLVLGLILFFVARYPLSEKFMTAIGGSQIAPYLIKLAGVFMPLVPEALKLLKDTLF